MKREKGVVLLGGLVGFTAGMWSAIGIAEIEGENYEKLGVIPKCDKVRSADEALVPVADDKVTQQIGRSAVCKIDDQVFRLVLQQK